MNELIKSIFPGPIFVETSQYVRVQTNDEVEGELEANENEMHIHLEVAAKLI